MFFRNYIFKRLFKFRMQKIKYRVDYSTRYFTVYPNKLLKKNNEFGLYSLGGPSGTRTPDRPVMSRML